MTLNGRPHREGVPPDYPGQDGNPGTPDVPGCPEAEQLAEYADGVLDAESRHAIEAHLVTCADCRSVLVETMAFLDAEAQSASDSPAAAPAAPAASVPAETPAVTATTPATAPAPAESAVTPTPTPTSAPARVIPFRSRSWVTGVGATLAAAAALVLIVRIAAPAWLPSWLGGGPPLEALVAALETQPTRPVEGRLMGGFPYASAPSPMRGGADRLGRRWSADVELAAAEIAKFAEGNTSVRARAALGVALIVSGDLDEAITALEGAAKDAPNDAAVQTNLSAAYLARARWLNHPEDWPKALTAADRAVALAPDAPEPYFNRALAYEGLDQTERAERAWGDYTARDRNSAWAREAEERKKALMGR